MHTQRNNPLFQHLMPFSKKNTSFAPNVVDNQKLESKFDSSLFSEDEDMPNVRMPQEMQTSVFSAFNYNRPVNTDQFADEFDSSFQFLSSQSPSNGGFKQPKDITDETSKNNPLFPHNPHPSLQKKIGLLQSPILNQKNDKGAKPAPPRTQATGLTFFNNWKSKMNEQSTNKPVNSMTSNFTSPNPLSQNFREKNKCSPAVNNVLSSISPVLNFRNNNSLSSENSFSRVSFNVDLDEENEDYDQNVSLNKNLSPLPKRIDYEKVIQSPSREKRSIFFSPKVPLEASNTTSELCSRPSFLMQNDTEINPNINDVEPSSPSDSITADPPFMEESNHDSGRNELIQSSNRSLQKVTDEASDFRKDASDSNDLHEKKCSDEENQSNGMKKCDTLSKSDQNNIENSAKNNSDYEKTNLTLLHLKLKNEADKIRKWHLSIENTLKSKEKTIAADGETISCLRKSQLDLKLSVESLSSRLKDEVRSREDFNEKIVSTRHLCNALKDHLHRVDEVQKSFNKERLKIHGLMESFKLLFEQLSAEKQIVEEGIEEMEKICRAKVTQKKEELLHLQSEYECQKREFQSRIDILQENLSSTQGNLHAKEQALLDFENTINSLKSEIQNQQLAIDQLVLEKQSMADNVAEKDSVIQKYQEQVSQLHDSVSTSEALINDLQGKILVNEKTIAENDSSLTSEREKSLRLENEVTEHDNCLKLERKRVEELEELSKRMGEQIKQLTNTVDGLRMNLEEERINFLKDYSTVLLSNEEMANEIQGLNSKINDAEKHIMDLEDREIDIAFHSENIIATILSEKSLLQENMLNLFKEKNEAVCHVNNLKEEIISFEAKYSNLKDENLNKESELSILKNDLSLMSDVNSKLNNDLSVTNEESKRLQMVLEVNTLKIQELEGNLKENIRVAEEAEKIIEMKQMNIEEINAEKMNVQTLLSDKMLHLQQCQSKISELEAVLMKERESHDVSMKCVEEKTIEIQEIRAELKNKCLECEKFQQEHVRLKCELGTTLEHYESERMSILKQKEDEMEKLKSELTNEAQKSNKNLDKKMSEANAKIDKLKIQLKNAHTNKANLTKITDRNHLLEKEFEEMKFASNKEMEELRITIDRLKTELQFQEDEKKSYEEIEKTVTSLKAENEAKDRTLRDLRCDIETTTSKFEKAEENCMKLQQIIDAMKKHEIDTKRFEEKRVENLEASCNISCKTPENINKKRTFEYSSNENVLRSPLPTPIPKETLSNLARTPKSPGLSACLWKDKQMSVSSQHSAVNVGINECETPRKTPKSILKQPGSASKRRRVFFGGENTHEMSDIESSCSEVVDLQTMELEKILSKKRNMNPKILQTMRTPKSKPKLFQQRISPGEKNLRKTPSRTPNTFRGSSSSVKPKPKNVKEDFWFDSDNDFSVINEY